MTPDQLVSRFIAAGFDTEEKVDQLLGHASKHIRLSQIGLAMQALDVERNQAMVPFNDRRTVLLNEKQVLEAALTPPLPPAP